MQLTKATTFSRLNANAETGFFSCLPINVKYYFAFGDLFFSFATFFLSISLDLDLIVSVPSDNVDHTNTDEL